MPLWHCCLCKWVNDRGCSLNRAPFVTLDLLRGDAIDSMIEANYATEERGPLFSPWKVLADGSEYHDHELDRNA